MAHEDEIVMYLVARTDLAMSPGKLGVQVGHGVQLAMRAAERSGPAAEADLFRWEGKDYPKLLLAIKGEEHLLNLSENLTKSGIPNCIVTDLGRTELAPNTRTLLSVIPMLKSKIQALPYMKRMRLY